MKVVKLLLGVICFVLVVSCSRSLERDEYARWVKDYNNGLHVRKKFSEFVYDVQYQPIQYLSLQSSEPLERNLHYFVLKISLEDPAYDLISYQAASPEELQQRLYYFSYHFQEDLQLEQDGQLTPCVLFHFEQSDLRSDRTFVLGFERLPNPESTQLRLMIQSPLLSTLPIKINTNVGDIPSLKL